MSIFDAAMRYRDEGVPLIVLAGKEYGTGSSRDWAAKGPALLGVRARCEENLDTLVAAIVAEAKAGDHIVVMSNGGFGGIHGKLLDRLSARV